MKQLDPKAVWYFFFAQVLWWLIVAIFFAFSVVPLLIVDFFLTQTLNIGNLIVLLPLFVLILVLVVAYIWAKLTYHFYKYELSEDGFKKEQGVIWKKYVTIPYDRIQNVDIHRGIIARILGLSDISIQTAGASFGAARHSEGRVPGLSREVAEELRDEVIRRAKGARTGGL